MIRWRGWNRQSTVYHSCRSFVRWYEQRFPLTRKVYLYAPERIYGLYVSPKRKGFDDGDEPAIFLMLPMRRRGVVHTLAHELVHHEQFSAPKPLTERGVRSRAASLIRRWQRDLTTEG